MFGENLTTEGIDLTDALVGERWRVGSAVLQVTSPRVPCWKLGARMGDPRFLPGSPQPDGLALTWPSWSRERSAPVIGSR